MRASFLTGNWTSHPNETTTSSNTYPLCRHQLRCSQTLFCRRWTSLSPMSKHQLSALRTWPFSRDCSVGLLPRSQNNRYHRHLHRSAEADPWEGFRGFRPLELVKKILSVQARMTTTWFQEIFYESSWDLSVKMGNSRILTKIDISPVSPTSCSLICSWVKPLRLYTSMG